MTNESRELILELASLADDERKPVTRLSDESSFSQAGLGSMSAEEAHLVCCVYKSQGRNLEITSEGITICPSRRVLRQIRFEEIKKSKQEVA